MASDASRVAVLPRAAFERRQRLFHALATSFGVAFGSDPRGADAAIVFGGAVPPGIRALVIEELPGRSPGAVQLGDVPALDSRLRGRRLEDAAAFGAPLALVPGDVVFAASAVGPVWALLRDGTTRRAAVGPDELAAAESLRDQLVDGRFLGLLPVVELLRAVTSPAAWMPPPLHASFVLDDPNLHHATYGHVDFRRLAEHAGRHGYHVSVATVPADQWLVSRAAAAVFRASRALSLAIHGNTHLHSELARPLEASEREALVAQALRRVESLERRAGLRVSRVMVAPHERCSEPMAETLARSSIEALCYGWGVRSDDRPLADWEPRDLRPSGLPVLPRRPLGSTWGELALRAYLDQPLILRLHHQDLAGGLDVLAEAAAEIDRMAAPAWASLEAVARTGVSVRRDGSTLLVKPYSRRFGVAIGEDVGEVEIELPATHAAPAGERLVVERDDRTETFSFVAGRAGPVPVTRGGTLQAALVRDDAFDHRVTRRPGRQPWARQRRMLAETRDRIQPLAPRRRVGR